MRSARFFGAKYWNSFPVDIKRLSSAFSFHQKIRASLSMKTIIKVRKLILSKYCSGHLINKIQKHLLKRGALSSISLFVERAPPQDSPNMQHTM